MANTILWDDMQHDKAYLHVSTKWLIHCNAQRLICGLTAASVHSAWGGRHLAPLARLKTAVRVDPQLLAVALKQVDIQECLDLALHELRPVPYATRGQR